MNRKFAASFFTTDFRVSPKHSRFRKQGRKEWRMRNVTGKKESEYDDERRQSSESWEKARCERIAGKFCFFFIRGESKKRMVMRRDGRENTGLSDR